MCIFSSSSMPAPPPPPEIPDDYAVDDAGVPAGHADSLTQKQKRFRAGQMEEETESLLT